MGNLHKISRSVLIAFFISGWFFSAYSQVPPSPIEISRYTGLLAAAVHGDLNQIKSLTGVRGNPDIRDRHGRTPLHIAAYEKHHAMMEALVRAGADPNAFDHDRYDIVTIAAVANDVITLRVALSLGASAKNVTSPYDGTALIAAAHLGHVKVVELLTEVGAPLDHINNLGWTALIESIVLGDGGSRHLKTLQILVKAGADVNLADSSGQTPLELARSRGYNDMVSTIQDAIDTRARE